MAGGIGQRYSVELTAGTSFVGNLSAVTPEELAFSTQNMGTVHVQWAHLRRLTLLAAGPPPPGLRDNDDVGNGDRLFFAPTARNLRKGEGYAQSLDVLVLAASYGFTDNFSLGVLATVVPGLGASNIAGIMPKVSFPVAKKAHLGGGGLLLFTKYYSFGVVYANGTYGSADHHLTAGLGYGYTGEAGVASTPVLLVGGATRVSRRVSLVNETYLLRHQNYYDATTLYAGIAGIRIAGPVVSGGLGLFYAGYSQRSANYGNGHDTQAFPFAELSVRFGNLK